MVQTHEPGGRCPGSTYHPLPTDGLGDRTIGRTESLVELIDLYPTLSELAGLEAPGHLQRKSFVPILKDPSATIRDTAFPSYPARLGKANTIGNSIRTADYRYTEWWEKDQAVYAVATNMTEDPGETTAVNDAALMEELSEKLRERVMDARE